MEPSKNESNPLHPPPPSPTTVFSSLPKDIVLCILAHISSSYYPTLSLVSKRFHSLIISKALHIFRSQLGTVENCVYVCLQSPTYPRDRRWFSLLINHNNTKSKENLLLNMPSSYSPRLPIFHETIGSKQYCIGGIESTSSSKDVWVYDNNNKMIGHRWCKAPTMTVARKNPLMWAKDGKLYVMGGCDDNETTYWGEVFDAKTQIWEPLPDPGPEIRFSLLKKLRNYSEEEKIYMMTNEKLFIYDIKERKWRREETVDGRKIMCRIKNVPYCVSKDKVCKWFDYTCLRWKVVKCLGELDGHLKSGHGVDIGGYGEKLVMFWFGPGPKIMCAVIFLEKNLDVGEVSGRVEWVDCVLSRVPWTHKLLCCVESVH
ncbi:unnamed protein product [Cochlearia groenlandica]